MADDGLSDSVEVGLTDYVWQATELTAAVYSPSMKAGSARKQIFELPCAQSVRRAWNS